MTTNKDLKIFAKLIAKILKTDRWVFIVCDGDMGEGKSCITSQLAKLTALETKTHFSYNDNMTYLRSDLKKWVDGDENGKGQKQEYSTILADEIISMFFKRNWYDSEQIDGIELLNKCRDRHLCVIGNIPNFWDLDSAIYPMVTFWVHVAERGKAWVFQKDQNPFAIDKWHKLENRKRYAKTRNPQKAYGFVMEINFPDWDESDKDNYYNIRNVKRKNTEGQRANKVERHALIKKQRDELIRFIWLHFKIKKRSRDPEITQKLLSEVMGVDRSLIGHVIEGIK